MLFYLICQEATQIDPAVVDIDIVDKRIGPGKVDPFKKTRCMSTTRELSGMQSALFIVKTRLARFHVFKFRELHDFKANALGGDGIRR